MKITSILSILLILTASQALACKWQPATTWGSLKKKYIREASGVASSKAKPGFLYHINDHGDGNKVFITNQKGKKTKVINISGKNFKDQEDLATGPCPGGSCLFIADTGNNALKRKVLNIIILKETSELVDLKKDSETVAPLGVIKFKYPKKGRHDSETLMVHPNGDIYIVTKVENAKRTYLPSQIYRIKKKVWHDYIAKAPATAKKKKKKIKPELVGYVNLPEFYNPKKPRNHLITSGDISPDGKKVLLLTYGFVIEINLDLSKATQIKIDKNNRKLFNIINIKALRHQEAITFSENGSSFLYNTEAGKKKARIMKVTCK
ncbi:MAG: hypothetical protein HOE90_16845 [Bacteriovoracaceae bacterium]|jgi:hypothetical protein|nr:hypothetical protein [Bacteriovoracaceae bacterium]